MIQTLMQLPKAHIIFEHELLVLTTIATRIAGTTTGTGELMQLAALPTIEMIHLGVMLPTTSETKVGDIVMLG